MTEKTPLNPADLPGAKGQPPPGDKNTINVHIEDEMRGAYLDYAMSVIIGRALPDVRDGLKPVHRRALYAMHDLGNTKNKPYKKSARVVGDVIGKYHPHGDTAVYDTIVRMAQDFSLRYPLVDGQGNFGSIDGDAPAAMRYTEIRMESITDELLADIEKETVDFGPNYDDSLKEPLVMPAKFPNLLVNGAAGIAVGMATNIPPHNLTEVIDATVALIRKPELDAQALLQYVKGPDFPTAGFIVGGSALKQAYLTGKAVVTMRAKAEIEPMKADRERIVVTELPYQVNKAKLIEKIAELVRDKRIQGISDLRDESDRKGMRIAIEIRKGENSNVILNQLYKLTQLQDSYGISLLAIHNGQPKIFNLRDMIWAFIEHRKDVVIRRTVFDLKKAEARAHILEGLKRAVENLDPIITLIKSAKTPNEARDGLISKFSFSEIQAQAILDMRLQRLTGLERDKIVADYAAVMKLIEELKLILASEKLVFEIIEKELLEIKDKFGDERRTQLLTDATSDFEVEDLIADEETLVTITHSGYIKRSDLGQFRSQRRGGKGVKGVTTNDDDFVSAIYKTTTLSYLLCFTDKGRLYWLKVYQIPDASRIAKGKAIVNLIQLQPGEKVVNILPVQEFKESESIVLCTRDGTIKKTSLAEFANVRKVGILAISITDGDALVKAVISNGQQDIFICTQNGKSIRFPEDNVRVMGRSAQGVSGISLEDGDKVVTMEALDRLHGGTPEERREADRADSIADEADGGLTHTGPRSGKEILIATEGGYGKRTPVEEYRLQSRAGKGIKSMNMTDKTGKIIAAFQVTLNDEVMMVSNRGKMIRMPVKGISEQGRVTQGVRLMSLEGGEKVVAVERIADSASDSVADGIPNGEGPAGQA